MGAFGSTTQRETYWVAPKNGPAPGQYDENTDLADATTELEVVGKVQKARVRTAVDGERRMPNSVFNSASNRFDLNYQKTDPKIRLLTSKGVPKKKFVTQTHDNKAIMGNQQDLGVENQITCLGYSAGGQSDWRHQTRASDFEKAIGKKVGFDGTSPRFNFNEAHHGQSLKFDIPGPGQYNDKTKSATAFPARPHSFNQSRNKKTKYSVVFDTTERRFKTKG